MIYYYKELNINDFNMWYINLLNYKLYIYVIRKLEIKWIFKKFSKKQFKYWNRH